jgi:hypothetical protein
MSIVFTIIFVSIPIVIYSSISFVFPRLGITPPSAEWTALVLNYLIWVVAVLINRVEWIYLKTEKSKAWLSNSTTHLQIQSAYTATVDEIEIFKKQMIAFLSKEGKLDFKPSTDHHSVFSFHEILIELKSSSSFDPVNATDNNSIDAVLNINMAVPYRRATKLFDSIITPLLESLNNTVKNEKRNYTLEVDFLKRSNPFFGLYVKRLATSGHFRWEYSKQFRNNDGLVQITKDKIFIRTQSLSKFGNQARNYFSLSGSFIS